MDTHTSPRSTGFNLRSLHLTSLDITYIMYTAQMYFILSRQARSMDTLKTDFIYFHSFIASSSGSSSSSSDRFERSARLGSEGNIAIGKREREREGNKGRARQAADPPGARARALQGTNPTATCTRETNGIDRPRSAPTPYIYIPPATQRFDFFPGSHVTNTGPTRRRREPRRRRTECPYSSPRRPCTEWPG